MSTPPKVSAKLLESVQASVHDESKSDAIAQVISELTSIQCASTAIVVMAIPRERIARMPTTFGFVVPPKEQRAVLAGSFASEKFPQRAPADHVIVRAFVGGVLNPAILENDDDVIVDIVAKELGDFIGLDHSVSVTKYAAFVRVVRWNNAMPQYEIGHLEKAITIDTAMSEFPRIHLRTNAIGGVGISPVIGSAKRMAESLLAQANRNESPRSRE